MGWCNAAQRKAAWLFDYFVITTCHSVLFPLHHSNLPTLTMFISIERSHTFYSFIVSFNVAGSSCAYVTAGMNRHLLTNLSVFLSVLCVIRSSSVALSSSGSRAYPMSTSRNVGEFTSDGTLIHYTIPFIHINTSFTPGAMYCRPSVWNATQILKRHTDSNLSSGSTVELWGGTASPCRPAACYVTEKPQPPSSWKTYSYSLT